jgi:thymidylate synthase ThyX
MVIRAEVICDSISPQDIRLTTMSLRYPKFIHGEMMTHRVFSRNASSSRAVPTVKLLEEARSDALRATPVFWGKNQKGMQAAEELEGSHLYCAQDEWKRAALSVVGHAEWMANNGVHKQIVNRLLEPFSHINVIVTATEWDNFFGLRLHKDAQPEMRALAVTMWEARQVSVPKPLKPGEWHLPYVLGEEFQEHAEGDWPIERLIKVSVARCARVSYLSFDTGKRSTVEEDLALYDRLMGAQPFHASPAEHQATPDQQIQTGVTGRQTTGGCYGRGERTGGRPIYGWAAKGQWGNFSGWRQYRKMLKGEAVAPLPKEYHSVACNIREKLSDVCSCGANT